MMQQYSIHKTGKQYVVRAEGKDLLICESRREAEHIIYGAAKAAETSVSRASPLTSLGSHRSTNSTGMAAEGTPCSNADVLAKAILDIKLILDIEKALVDDPDFGRLRNPRQVLDRILTIIDEADAVDAAKRIQAGFHGLKVVK
jgi:hypothetical protein